MVPEVARVTRWALLPLALLLAVLVTLSLYSYPLFHTLAEMLCIMVAASIFIVVFHTRGLLDNHYLLFVGVGFLFFAILGVPHMLGYKGIQLLRGFDNDLPTQAFVAQRLLLASTFLIAPVFLRRRLRLVPTIGAFAFVVVAILMSLLVWRNFPQMFADGVGLTPLKKALEYVLSAMFLASGWLLVRERRAFDPDVLRLLLTSLGCFIGSELAFTLYATPFGLSNLGGHLFQLAGFYFAYRAVLVTALVNPFGLLFRELSGSERSLREANAQLNAVAEISDTAMSTLDLDELMPRLLARLVEVMHADAALLMLADGESLTSFAAVGLRDIGFTLPMGQGFAGTIAATRKPGYLHNAQAEDSPVNGQIREQGIRSMLGAPLMVGDGLVGVLHVDWLTHHAFSDDDLRLLGIVADRVALAVRNAQVYGGEHHIAQTLQKSLLSLPEELAGLVYARTYHSATKTASVGGDFYDLFDLDDSSVGILIGDVSGKGVEAAVLTALVKNTIRAHAHRGASPAEVLRLTNEMVERYSEPGSFVTVFFGLLDRRDGSIVYCNAGHPSVMIRRGAGDVVRLSPNSPLVGAFPDMAFADDKSSLEPGEVLVMYTDGLIEARRGPELYGEDRLGLLLGSAGDRGPQETVDALLEDLTRFTGGALSDDLAILALALVAAGEPCRSKAEIGSADSTLV